MNNTDLKDYFQNVLGVQSVFPLNSAADSSSVLSSEPSELLKIFVENLSTYSKPETELLKKVLSSIGLSENQVHFVFDPMFKDECRIHFVDHPSEMETEISSPRAMNLDPSLKKLAWAKLQKISMA